MAYQKSKNDIGITDVGSAGAGTTVIGMMLATQPDGSKAYREYDGKYLADQFFTGAPSQAYMNPEEELILSQTDWRKGFGEEYYDDPKRYYSSIGMDLRHKGMAMAGWTPTAIAQKYTWTNPTGASGWTNSTNAINGTTTDYAINVVNGGGKAWSAWLEVTFASAEVGSIRYYMEVADEENNHFNNIVVEVYTTGWAESLAETTIVFDRWVEHSIDTAGITKIRMKVYNNDVNERDAAIAAIQYSAKGAGSDAVVTRAFAEFNDELYRAGDATLYKLNAAGDGFFPLHTFAANITDLEPFTDNQLYIALGISNDYWYMTTAEVFTVTTGDEKEVEFFCVVHAASPTMYANYSAYQLKSTTDPSGAATWAGATTVGSSYHNITDLISWQGLLYIMKEDKPYYLDSTPAIQDDLAIELESAYATTSGKNAWVWKNKLYIPAGAQALLETDGTTNTFRNPASYCSNLSDFVGRVIAIAHDEEWLFIAVDKNDVGAQFDGTTGCDIDAGAIHDAAAKLWVSFWFKLDSDFDSSATDNQTLFGKSINATNGMTVFLGQSSGKLHFSKASGGVEDFDVSSSETSWTAGRWYHVIASISSAAGVRLIVDNGTAVTDADVSAAPNGGNFFIGNMDFKSSGNGLDGTIRNFVVGTDDLSTAEETSLYEGIAPSDKVNHWELHEGSGSTAYDDGSGSNNGTLDSAVSWLNGTEILAGRLETIDGTTSWVWHPVAEVDIGIAETMFTSNVYKKRLWVASTHTTESLYYISLPTGYGDIINDSNKDFKTGVTFETPYLHSGFRSENKAWIKITLTMGQTYNANRYFTVKYKKLGDTSWTNIGDFTGASGNMAQSRYIDTTNKPFSPMMKFQFTAVTNDTNYTPILLSYDVRAIMYPTIRKVIHCVVRCAEEMTDRQGKRMPNQYDVVKDALDNARNNAVWPVSIRDINGDTLNVKFLPVSQETARMIPIKIEKGREQERIYHLLMLEVPLA